jgi:hypothetical protein
MRSSDPAKLLIPLPNGERWLGEAESVRGLASAIPLIRRCAPPSPRWGEEKNLSPRGEVKKEVRHVL